MEKHLHIINFTVPYPVNYGGVVDLFWKLPALHQLGVHIHLHCFNYGRGVQDELLKYCKEVHYYKRNSFISNLFSSLPFIVASRKNEILFERLLQDGFPILMEGVHSSYLLNDSRFNHRRKYVRLHNIEHQYYFSLYQSATYFIKKIYYKRESGLLKNYEKAMTRKANSFWCVTEKDAQFFNQEFGFNNVSHIPLFLPEDWTVKGLIGKGGFCLYQGDLSVDANSKVIEWLLNDVWKGLNIPLKIAGKNPSDKLIHLAGEYKNVQLIANPDNAMMQDLIANAQINILPSFSNSGIKLKLLNALYNGRHCLVNDATANGSGVESLCYFASTANEWKQHIQTLFEIPFDTTELYKRKAVLSALFNNEISAGKIIETIWDNA